MTNKPLTGYSHVACITQGGKKYFYALYDPDVSECDAVVVTGAAAGEIWLVDAVCDAKDADIAGVKPTEEVICKVDFPGYRKYLDRVADRQRARELKQELNALHGSLISNISEEYLESICGEYKDLKRQLKSIGDKLGLE